MSWTGLAAAAAILIPAHALPPRGGDPAAPGPPSDLAAAPGAAEISVLTYNVKGLPWPAAWGRAAALRKIGGELARLRREGRQPDVVLIQEGFRGEIAIVVVQSDQHYPRRSADPTVPDRCTERRVEPSSNAAVLLAERANSRCIEKLASDQIMRARRGRNHGARFVDDIDDRARARARVRTNGQELNETIETCRDGRDADDLPVAANAARHR